MSTATTYAIVENPGQDSERVIRQGLSYRASMLILQENYTREEQGDLVQIMRELPDGSLTTEF